ncbi:helix-turn-helix domain-containing protein [Microbacterium aurantiacum]|uniref:helix-turn-helix domain-containing protein n=1 Tax=Microbacterium aurantiacum TaxID=162393 RepID=UPI001F2B352F|nr:cupin domain-containing protein [Microbacterium aurantiacum]
MDDPVDQAQLQTAIGQAVRAARRGRSLTLQQVATASGVSAAFLSQTETGKAVPSIMTLHRIAIALGTTTHELLAQSTRSSPTLIDADVEPVRFRDGVDIRFLSAGRPKLTVNELHVAPGADAGEHTSHTGDELVYVITGIVLVELQDDRLYRLKAGDALSYSAETGHRWSNPGTEPSTFLIVNAPPSF